MAGQLSRKVALITGGGRGIGRAIANAYAREGAQVVLAARTKTEIEAVRQEIQAEGYQALSIPTDVREEASVQHLITQTLKELGHIDILVNNAGVLDDFRPLFSTSLQAWDAILNTNLRGAFLCTKHIWRFFVSQHAGCIINIGSILASHGAIMQSTYATSKSGLIGLTKSMALEGEPFHIRANLLCPGLTATQMLEPLKRWREPLPSFSPERVTGPALFLASDAAQDISGQTLLLGYVER
jgi:NAD(P)-dependent dehydrogenase (short-subunit alcohol dehydrogenase family)